MDPSHRAIAKIYERDMDLVLIEELQSSDEFRRWLVARVFGTADLHTATHSVTDRTGRESDIVYIFETEDGNNAILIENKIDAIAQPNQGVDYRKRGEAGKGEQWQDYKTCLVAPKAYLKDSGDARNFDETISYEELLAYFVSRKQRDPRFAWKARLVEDAIIKKVSAYTPEISEVASEWVKQYFEFAKSRPDLGMAVPKPRAAGNTWVTFRPESLPHAAVIEHQVKGGAVKLFFPNAADRFEQIRSELTPLLSPGMEIVLTGKSIAVCMDVPRGDMLERSFAEQRQMAQQALEAVAALAGLLERATRQRPELA